MVLPPYVEILEPLTACSFLAGSHAACGKYFRGHNETWAPVSSNMDNPDLTSLNLGLRSRLATVFGIEATDSLTCDSQMA